jgi:hypothetical protein
MDFGTDALRGGPARITPPRSDLWAGVDRLIDRAPSFDDLRVHRLHLLAARRHAEKGLRVPRELVIEELTAIARTVGAREVLSRARQAYDGELLILKGPEIAALYPDPALRPSNDLDLLAEDPEGAQRSLLAAGFKPIGPYPESYYQGLHHLRPLGLPGSVGPWIEIHRRPNWVQWSDPPSAEELLDVALPAANEVKGLLALPPDYHAVVLVAHSWADAPLRRVLDLVDVLALTRQSDRERIRALSSTWALARAWDATIAAADGLLLDGPAPLSLRTWARDLPVPRDRSVLEGHIRRWVGPFWAHPPAAAARALVVALIHDATPVPGETWSNKLLRVREAIAHPNRPSAEQKRILGIQGIRPRHKRRYDEVRPAASSDAELRG